MNKVNPGKQKQILGVAAGTVLAMAAIYFFLIVPLHASLTSAENDIQDAQSKLSKYKFAMQKTAELQATSAELTENLDRAEATLPKGDAYLWMLDSLQAYKERPNLEFTQIEPPHPAELNSIPTLPYPNMGYGISGAAYYSDFGLFLADFENNFPYLRIRSLELEPAAAGRPGEEEREKLRFKFEFVTPAKPTITPKL